MEIEKITVIIIPTRIIIAIMMMILIMKVTIASIMILNTSLLIWRNKWQNDSNGNCITGNNENDKLQTPWKVKRIKQLSFMTAAAAPYVWGLMFRDTLE